MHLYMVMKTIFYTYVETENVEKNRKSLTSMILEKKQKEK